ncbi:protein-disulfide reductase DsbD [Azomonas macrocytogenes]|uniref:Thiol:disulfide interchange protein DsbD n=1 Tax=Azomonas macrocytogenes TaxID=69962 RepID=A0A839TC10_AZOMA|nr:protein-disulfide reductase DsbD [Azomonas macrocytogenes]MBB3105133.1 thiol:disulfide interchange protein DsbD [Azomonas macrocytogenes]
MRCLLILLLFVITLPASAGLFDSKPSSELGSPLNNSADFLPVRQAFQLNLIEEKPEQLRLQIIAADGYYLYRHRFQFKVVNENIALGEAQLPEGQKKTDEYFGAVEIYRGVLDIDLPLENPHNLPFTLQVTYQGCADQGLCYPPETESIAIGKLIPSDSNPSSSHGTAASKLSWHALSLFFLAGLGLAFTPCVLPMLPILSGVVLREQSGGIRSLLLALAYVLPMAAVFALLGVLMGIFGAELNLQARLQSPWILVPFSLFFVAFALAMFGLFELRLPHFISTPLDRLAGKTKGGSFTGAALLGALSSLLVSPCVSAPLAGALLYISSSGDALGGGFQLFTLGLGMGMPLIVFATGGNALLPKTGAWMVTVRHIFGVLLLGVAVWMLERILAGPLTLVLWGLLAGGTAVFLGTLEFTSKSTGQKLAQLLGLALLVYAMAAWIGALQGASDPLRPLPRNGVATEERRTWQTVDSPVELEAQLAAASATGQPLLLDWYADWCISCKVIEREVLENPRITPLLARYRLVRFDITESNSAQRTLLDHFGLFGPPALLFFDHSGKESTELRIVGEIDTADFEQHLTTAQPLL